MRKFPDDIIQSLAGETTTLCWLWRLSLEDGTQLGFTDHDLHIETERSGDGLVYEAKASLNPSESERRLGLSIDTGGIQGVLSSERIRAEDIMAGRYENALLESFLYDWKRRGSIVAMTRGRLGRIRRHGERFEAEWVGEAAWLERSVGRVFSRLCDARFGDDHCGLNLSDYPEDMICSRSFRACRDQFQNSENYRGFPYLLGDDALQAGPQEGEPRDGGSRYL